MSLNSVETIAAGICPVCEAMVVPDEQVEESEIITCLECQSSLVVESINDNRLRLEEAPIIEEDWGE